MKVAKYEYEHVLYAQAEPLLRRALIIREQVLGVEHPDTAQSLNNLAYLYFGQGKYEQAELLYQRVLTVFERVLGTTHPSTIIARRNYMDLREKRNT